MPINMYLLTADGYNDSYGSAIYALGVFDSEKQAVKAKEECGRGLITKLELNKIYPLKGGTWWDGDSNDKYLGGYIE